ALSDKCYPDSEVSSVVALGSSDGNGTASDLTQKYQVLFLDFTIAISLKSSLI
ncbi:8513_t:CDS:1, partial [Ambispora leptoticha]